MKAARLVQQPVSLLEKLHGEGMDQELKEYIMWPGAADAILLLTVYISVIRGGIENIMIPSECVFEVDIRTPIGVRHG